MHIEKNNAVYDHWVLVLTSVTSVRHHNIHWIRIDLYLLIDHEVKLFSNLVYGQIPAELISPRQDVAWYLKNSVLKSQTGINKDSPFHISLVFVLPH